MTMLQNVLILSISF